MKAYEFFDHTADVKFKAYGKTLEELFLNAARAMFSLILRDEDKNVEKKITFELKLEANSIEALLFDFLEELIVLLEGEDFLFSDADITITKGSEKWLLNAKLYGDAANNYKIWKGVKAVTYSEFYIKKLENGIYETQIILDI